MEREAYKTLQNLGGDLFIARRRSMDGFVVREDDDNAYDRFRYAELPLKSKINADLVLLSYLFLAHLKHKMIDVTI